MVLTGVIIDVKIKLKKIGSRFINKTTLKTKNLKVTFEAFEKHKHNPYSVAWIDCLGIGDKLGKYLLILSDFSNDGDLNY